MKKSILLFLLLSIHCISFTKKSNINNWHSPKETITDTILILAGHQPNPTTGSGDAVFYKNEKRTTESFLTLRMVPILQKLLKKYGFKTLLLESKKRGKQARINQHKKADIIEDETVFAIELHFDSPKGSSGVIPGSRYENSGEHINPYDKALADEFGYFSMFHRGPSPWNFKTTGLSGPRLGISLLEVAALTPDLQKKATKAITTNNFREIDLFLKNKAEKIAQTLYLCRKSFQ